MKILVLGGTGRVGRQIVTLALKGGHHVKALVRDPDKMTIRDENLFVMKGNVLNQKDIDHAISGTEIVISALNTDGSTTLSDSLPFIIKAMNKEGIKRIITIGTAGILQSRITPNILRYQSSESKRKSTKAAEEHHKAFEILEKSGLDWTIVCPTYLPDGSALGTYRVEKDFLPEDGLEISVPDTAEFAYSLVNTNDYIKSRVGIAY